MTPALSRRRLLASAALALLTAPRALLARVVEPGHPAPRAGITAAKLPTREQLADVPEAIPVFDLVREIPQVIDGIRCQCGCAGAQNFYSLLSCFEGEDAMARHCAVCQGEARLAHRLHKQGKSLDAIRKGVDARYG